MLKDDADFFRVKASHGDLIDRAGGQKRSGDLVGLSQQMMSCVQRRDHRALLTVRGKLVLERECGEPLATRVEAELLGYRLERESGGGTAVPANPYAAFAAISQEYADLVGDFAQRTADGVFSQTDGLVLDRKLADLTARAEAFRRFIAAQMAGGAV